MRIFVAARNLCLSFLFFKGLSCQNTSDTSKREASFSMDSLAIVTAFDKAKVVPDSIGFFTSSAKAVAENDINLSDVYSFNEARFLLQTGQLAAAEKVLDSVLTSNIIGASRLGKFLNLKAAVLAYQSKIEEAVSLYEQALDSFEKEGDTKQAAAVHFNLANIFFSRLDFESSYDHITIARNQFEILKDSSNTALATGIMAVSLIKLDSLNEGKEMALLAKYLSEKQNNHMGVLLGLYALGEYEHSQGNFEKAVHYYDEAKAIGEKYRIRNLELPVQAARLNVFVKLKDKERAIETGSAAINLANAMNNTNIKYHILRNMAFAYEYKGDNKQSYQYLKMADSVFRNNIMDNNQKVIKELLVKYETEKKNTLLLQKESQIGKQKLYIMLLSLGALLVCILGYTYYRNVLQSRRIEQLNKEREIDLAISKGEESERKRLSEELHDGIASSLTALRIQMESQSNADGLIGMIKDTHNEVRKIAHNLMPVDFTKVDIVEVLRSFSSSLKTSSFQVSFFTNVTTINLPENHALVIYRAAQEILQNVIKHSEADEVAVQLMYSNKKLTLSIEDNGKGFDAKNEISKGGLYNLKTRLASIGGLLTIESGECGTTAFIEYGKHKS